MADLTGTAANDVLVGTNDDDTLNGLIGADKMAGGDGNDIYFVDQAGDVVTELTDKGFIDRVVTTVSTTLAANVEFLELVGGALSGTGNGQENVLLGNGLDNTLDGGDGPDLLSGGHGNDTLVGGKGHDYMVGGDGQNRLQGGVGGDTLNGFGGDNVMEGGAGNDPGPCRQCRRQDRRTGRPGHRRRLRLCLTRSLDQRRPGGGAVSQQLQEPGRHG